jgi:hypothetical protein
MPSNVYRSTVALLAVAALAGACGSGSDTTSSVEADPAEFCDQLTALEAASEGDVKQEDLASLREKAPAEIREDMVVLVGALEQLVGLDMDDPAAAEQAIELALDPAILEASENVDAFGVSFCGLIASPLSDSTDSVDPNAASIEGLQKHLDETHPDASWRPQLSLFTDSGNGFGVGGFDIEPDAIAICEAVLVYASGFGPDLVVGVTNLEEEYSGVGVEVVTGSVADGCDVVSSTPTAADDVVVNDSLAPVEAVTDEAVTDEAVTDEAAAVEAGADDGAADEAAADEAVTDEPTEPVVDGVLTEAEALGFLAGADRMSFLQPFIDIGMTEQQAECISLVILTNLELDDAAFEQLLVDCDAI